MDTMVIKFDEAKFPTNIQPRKYGPKQKAFLREAISRMLDAGILERSNSRFGCCPFTPYKADGSLRFCCDSRPANKVTEATKFPIPDMHEMVQSMNGSRFFAILDAAQGYFQCPLSPCSYKYAAVLTMDACYHFTHITMGQLNSGGYFQMQMRRILEGRMEPVVHLPAQQTSLDKIPMSIRDRPRLNLTEHGVLQYLDDTMIHAPTEELLFEHIHNFLERMRLLEYS
jgi:hypothetical protein